MDEHETEPTETEPTETEPKELNRLHRDMAQAFGFLMDEHSSLPALRAALPDDAWQRIVGFAGEIIETQRAYREGEPCPKLLAHNGTRAACRPKVDGRCCWCDRVI